MQLGLRERERKKLRTQQSIETAALELVDDHGLENVTIEAIAERADVTPRTFFNHFAGKEEALIGLPRNRDAAAADFPPGLDAPTPFLLGVELVRLQLREVDDETLAFDQKRRVVLQHYPHLLRREMERYRFFEDLATAYLDEALGDRGEPVGEQRTDRARAIVLLTGAAMRLAVETWCRRPEGPEGLLHHFDQAVQTMTAVRGTDAP